MVSPGVSEPPHGSAAGPDARADAVGGTAMLTALVRLRAALGEVRLPLDLPGTASHREDRDDLISQLEDYLIPRVTTMDGPLLVVVGGSTGAGKSTLVNTIVGTRVTESGVLRPTTRSPVLVHHPDDAGWFDADRLLPELVRVQQSTNDPHALQLVATASIPVGVAVLDAPDLDSVEEQNRHLAAELLAAADLWLFVTSAARYADQVPWEFLRQAADRATSVAVVLDRTSADDADTVATHLARMLSSRGLKDCPLFTVPEAEVDDDGLLPAATVEPLRGWLQQLADDIDARTAVAARTVGGAIRTLGGRSHTLAAAGEAQAVAVAGLREAAVAAYAGSVAAAREATADGTLVRGEVLVRWQELVGSGDLVWSLEERVGWLRDRVSNAVRGRPQGADRLLAAISAGLTSMLLEHARGAEEHAEARWRESEASGLLPAGGADTPDDSRAAERLAAEWQDGLTRMVRAESSDVRSTTRFLTYGVSGLTAALAVVVLSQAGGALRLPEGGTGGRPQAATVAERLLRAVFGEQAVRSLASRARSDLDRRVEGFVMAGADRFTERLDAAAPAPGAAEQLREAARRVDDVRFRSAGPALGGAPTP